MLRQQLGRFSVWAGALLLGSAVVVHAQSYYPPDQSNGAMTLDTFDATGTTVPAQVGGAPNPSYPGLYNANTNPSGVSFTNYSDNSGDANSWYNLWSPPPPNVRFDYSGSSHITTGVSWSNGSSAGPNGAGANNGYDDTPATNGGFYGSTTSNTPNSPVAGTAADTGGALALSSNVPAGLAGSGESIAFTMDIYYNPVVGANGQLPTGLSFNILVDPTSTLTDASFPAGYGYFQVFTRDNSYNENSTSNILVNGNNVGGGWELGNPTYNATSDAGTWDSVYVPLTGANQTLRALTLQEYTNGGSGTLTYYIDNVQVYVPEPASLGAVGIAVSGLLLRRRRAAI